MYLIHWRVQGIPYANWHTFMVWIKERFLFHVEYVNVNEWIALSMGFTYPIPDRWHMCTISYSISRWRTAISCGQYRSSIMIYYAEKHRQTVEKLTWLKGTYYTGNPSIRFMFVSFQYYCICWMSKLPRLKIKHLKIMITVSLNVLSWQDSETRTGEFVIFNAIHYNWKRRFWS